MLLIYACALFFTLTCESLPLNREYTPNVGTVLFSASDAQKERWSKTEIGLLQARRYLQNLLPPPIFVNTFNEEHVNALLGYFRDAYAAIKKEAKDPETDTTMTTALCDAIGGYLKVWILPVAKLDYYGGTISQANVIKLFQFYNEIKRYLDTDGDGWRKPDEKTLNSITINVAPLQSLSNTRSMKDPCDHLAYFEKTPRGLTIPIPNVSWNDKSSTLFVPLKNASLISMNTPDASQNLVKYYHTARSCIQSNNPREQEIFDKKFQKWLMDEVVPHLKDEDLYLALGSVLTLVNRTRDYCNTALDLYVNKCKPKYKLKRIHKLSMPCISCRKIWILTIILIIEIAWCVPALLYVLCSKRKDCSSHVYLFIDNNKKNEGDPKLSCCEDASTSCGGGAGRCFETPGEMRVIRKTVFSNTEFTGQCPSSELTNKCLSVNRSGRSIECPELYCVSRKSSFKKQSGMSTKECCDPTQIMALSSHETFGSKQSRSNSRHCFPSIEIIRTGKKKRDKDECNKQEKRKKSNDCYKKPDESKDCKKPEDRKKLEECKKLEERMKLEECKKQEERKKLEECKKQEERKKLEECKKLEERKKLEECKKLEERMKLEECKKQEERKKLEECKKQEERKKLEECKKLEKCKKQEERKKLEECKKLEERKKLEDRKRREEVKKLEECKKLEESRNCNKNEKLRQTEECRKPEERKKNKDFRKLDECRKRDEFTEVDESRKHDEYTEVDESKLGGLEKPEELTKHKNAAFCKNLEEKTNLTEPEEHENLDEYREVDECRDGDEILENDARKEFEECIVFGECQRPDDCQRCCDGSAPNTDESCLVNEIKYDGKENAYNCDDYDDFNEPMCCQHSFLHENPRRAICPCTKCVNKMSATNSNVTCCGMSLSEVKSISNKQVAAKTTRFQVKKEFKGKEKGSSKHSTGKKYLEITIDRPGTEICVDMSQCRTHNSPYRPSRIPKPATCSIKQAAGRQPTAPIDRHRSLIPQPKKKTSDDMDLAPCCSSKLMESKLNNSF